MQPDVYGLALPRRRRRLSVTSLIDVIFLLLLFFMLSSTFSRYAEIDLTAATGGGGTRAGTAPLFVQLGGEDLVLNGQPVALEALPGRLGGDAPVIVSLRGGTSAQRLADLLVVLRRVPDLAVTVLQ
ncbi:biopolymer transporter ExbD [Pseudoroseicyclus aestuarii]|uniref:Outer membrane transport energization protein ExbD n=1 Tax=Pseudoroseicyclus aestuarii TaxID=1795041 RepID=A0A318SWW3_9RHOB|nr:biopolymer transporter ExbD [Pseudoroseicyclus aestuarii]PYE84876.1 outer membrane transport energization protein ExbD [Pseudoroseicyclus aestuarii]